MCYPRLILIDGNRQVLEVTAIQRRFSNLL